MNAREFFYKDYYRHSIRQGNIPKEFSLKKHADKKDFDALKKENKPIIEDANRKLQNFALQKRDYQCLRLNTEDNKWLTEIIFTTTYPGLLIGTGYTHQSDNEAEFKLGFYFDFTSGIPCILGSSVKGVLRSVFPQLGRKLNELPKGKDITDIQKSKVEFIAGLAGWGGLEATEKTKKVHQLELTIFEGVDLENTKDGNDNEYLSIYNRFIFHNAYISEAKGDKIFETDTITPHPHPLKNPVPFNFLKIRSGVKFNFQFQLHNIDKLGLKKEVVMELFKEILEYTGSGAKTNVGYGQLKHEAYITAPEQNNLHSDLINAFSLLHTMKSKKRN